MSLMSKASSWKFLKKRAARWRSKEMPLHSTLSLICEVNCATITRASLQRMATVTFTLSIQKSIRIRSPFSFQMASWWCSGRRAGQISCSGQKLSKHCRQGELKKALSLWWVRKVLICRYQSWPTKITSLRPSICAYFQSSTCRRTLTN